ncbi:MAG: NAD(P)H-hydrate epimerase [Planctomycetales bacterium]|nr:NAD(P)H-hydrate epimerase [Planctomycetales bacterium]
MQGNPAPRDTRPKPSGPTEAEKHSSSKPTFAREARGADRILTRNEVRQIDRWAIESLGLPGIALMENAGAGTARILSRETENQGGGPVIILCGPGNNGGDGFVIARHLWNVQIPVVVHTAIPSDRYHGDALINLQVAQRLGIDVRMSAKAEPEAVVRGEHGAKPSWIVDALLGTGATGQLREPIRSWVEAANAIDCRRLAVDLPTGLDADEGVLELPIFQADVTATFVGLKPGLLQQAAQRWVGRIEVVGIGVNGPAEYDADSTR